MTIAQIAALVRMACVPLSILMASTAASADVVADCNQTRDLDRALKACTRFIEQGAASAQNLAVAYLNRANAYSMQRRFDRALPDYASAIQLDPDNPLPYYNRGNLHFDQSRFVEAVADYTHAIEKDASFALAYLNRGLAHERQGHLDAATEDYRQASAWQPTASQARRRLKQLRPNG